ncbi:TIGR02206 family membrane protein [Ichthyenterobacterium sp. W332]|uniref:TIGR02206 family membrane protein n=1 Tax=Microcosmobacter mediterraneus TaxID=3075607 RepID=A0ABU2YP92_9FLAO|nr:TIGR02206 family membrane protein [Ichthyenterobacterium sp. W332]MDT0559652.1 TIGR02206 family membrane protein [Ichthyenterobacterium sp. W332]
MERVQIGSIAHIAPIIFALIFGVLLIKFAKHKLGLKQQYKVVHVLALIISFTVIFYHVYNVIFHTYNFKTDLPLFLCSFMALIIPILTHYKKYWMYEILLFWIIAGTSQGVITPDIAEGFPSLDYFRYWIVHLGLLVVIFYYTIVFKQKPNIKSIFKSILALQVYMVVIMILNNFLSANYSYLNHKPESTSLLDYFGEWPYYILVVQLILIPYFFLIYLPFYMMNRKENRITISQKFD